jgi:hypothetical protein
MTTLYRRIGLHELALIWDSKMREFPRRLPQQPIFYPVANIECVTQIARERNTKDASFAGYVTKFSASDAYVAKLEPHTGGSATHVEFWVPAEQLHEFNASIEGRISVESEFFGSGSEGFVPDSFGLKGKDAVEQFRAMAKTRDHSRMDCVLRGFGESQGGLPKLLVLGKSDFTVLGVDAQQGMRLLPGSRKRGHLTTSRYHFRPSTERKTSLRSACSFGIVTSGWRLRRSINTIDPSSIAEPKSKTVHFGEWHIPVG